jgi:hypothetical protein
VTHHFVTPLLNILELYFPTQTLYLTFYFHNDDYYDCTFLQFTSFCQPKYHKINSITEACSFLCHITLPQLNDSITSCFAHPISCSHAAALNRLRELLAAAEGRLVRCFCKVSMPCLNARAIALKALTAATRRIQKID